MAEGASETASKEALLTRSLSISKHYNLVSLVIGAVLAALSVAGWVQFKISHDASHRSNAQRYVQLIATKLSTHIGTRLVIGDMIRDEWLATESRTKEAYAGVVMPKLRHFYDIQAINWVSPDGVILWVNPLKGNEPALGLNVGQLPGPGPVLKRAMQSRQAKVTSPIDLAQGGKGFVLYVPVFDGDTLLGFVNIALRAKDLIENAMPVGASGAFNLAVFDGEDVVFTVGEHSDRYHDRAKQTISIGNRTWDVYGEMATSAGHDHPMAGDEIFLVVGLIGSFTVAFLIRFGLIRHNELRDSEMRFAEFAEISSDWFWETDENLRFSFFSHRFEDVTGVAPSSMLGQTREEVGAPGADPEELQAMLDALREHREFREFEHFRIKPGGDLTYLSISGKPIFSENGKFLGFRGIGRDITEQKLSQQRLNAAVSESEQANQAKSEFLATMSHEFRTPLNAILGFSEMLRSQLFGPLGAAQYKQYANDIHDSGTHMLNLINDILDISAIEARRRTMMMEPVELVDLLNDCLRTVREQARERAIILSLKAPDDLPQLRADKRSITQIVLNLLSNALKFTGKGGEITVSVTVEEWFIAVRVRDTGIGIPTDQIPLIMEPFIQSTTNPHLAQQGTGLGLSIVRSLVEAHEGTFDIESEVGKGTTVTVLLPIEGPSPKE